MSQKSPNKKHAKKELEFDLLGNGVDFIATGISRFFLSRRPKATDKKYALLHVFSGTLLILKERLRREHPSLIFKTIEKAGAAGAMTVNFDEVIERLRACANVLLADEDKKLLRLVQERRNQIEHYEFRLNPQETEAVIGNLVLFLEKFMKAQLNVDLADHVPAAVWKRLVDLERTAERVALEWQKCAKKLAALPDAKLRALGEEPPMLTKHDASKIRFDCPQCEGNTVVLAPGRGDMAICTDPGCRMFYEVEGCVKCGDWCIGDELCANCLDYFEYQMAQD